MDGAKADRGASDMSVTGPSRERASRKTPLCFVGWGAIGQRVFELLEERAVPVELVAVGVRDASALRRTLPFGARLIADPGELASTGASLVLEMAGKGSVLPWGEAALRAGADFAVSSTSAFAEEGALETLRSIAQATGRQILIPPGALGGIDALAAASRLRLDAVTHRIVKPPLAWMGTGAEALCDLQGLTEPTVFFADTARAAAAAFPQNANVAVISSLAGIGLDRTHVVLVADPGLSRNIHEIHAEGEFGRLDVRVENRPLADNPKSSETTALNIVRLVENRVGAIAI